MKIESVFYAFQRFVVFTPIHTGDLMLFDDNCLVLFYDSFSTTYSYTPLGYVEDTTGFSQALDRGSVTVNF